MNLIIESDLGHDPDDFFAICYLVRSNFPLRSILVSPGDPDQIAVAKLLARELGLSIPIGASKLNRTKMSSGGIHHELLKKYGQSCALGQVADGLGADILEKTLRQYPDCELFVIGPASSVGVYLSRHPHASFSRATMQGGFCGYHIYRPKVILDKFEGQTWVPTFNLNGDRPAGLKFIEANIPERRFVGKNVCHTIVYNKEIHSRIKPWDRASELFKEGMDLYLDRHEEKKFHDPAAAVCHLHPEIGIWVRGKTQKIEGGWGTIIDENGDYILADINYEALWSHIANFD